MKKRKVKTMSKALLRSILNDLGRIIETNTRYKEVRPYCYISIDEKYTEFILN